MRILLVILFVIYSVGYSQSSVNAVIEYKQINNTDMANTYYCDMYVEGASTIFLPKYFSTKVFNDPNESAEAYKFYPEWEYLKIDHKKKEILYFDSFGPNTILVSDGYNKLDWVIGSESKTIAGYNCIRATTTFRGVDWVVWFTPEIAMPYGPWKLHGLPGLIVEASEHTNTYKWQIAKIEYRRDPIFDKDFASLTTARNKESIPVREFMNQEKEFYANAEAEYGNRLSFPVPPRSFELKYEWEE